MESVSYEVKSDFIEEGNGNEISGYLESYTPFQFGKLIGKLILLFYVGENI